MPRRSATLAIPVFDTSVDEPFYPDVPVMLGDLLGPEGNAFVILGRVMQALKEAGAPADEYHDAATSGDYENLLFVTRTWVRVLETGDGRPQDV